jgi:hypothetical protein
MVGRKKMSLRSILSTILLVTGISLAAALFNFSGDSTANNNDKSRLIADCDPSEWTYQKVLIDGVWWIIVYDCDGAIINEDPAT